MVDSGVEPDACAYAAQVALYGKYVPGGIGPAFVEYPLAFKEAVLRDLLE
jgi:hypothetical protein